MPGTPGQTAGEVVVVPTGVPGGVSGNPTEKPREEHPDVP